MDATPAFLDWLRQQNPDVQAPEAVPAAAPTTPTDTRPAFQRDAYLSDLKGAQDQDQAARDTLAKRVQWSSWLGNGMDPKAVELSMPKRAANLTAQMDAGKSLDEQNRDAEAFAPKLRTMTAQATEEEAKVPFAGRRAQADITERESRAAKERQAADTGQQTMEEKANLLVEAKDPDSLTSRIGRQLAEQAGLKVPPNAPYYAFQHLLPEANKQEIARVRAEAMMQAARTRGDAANIRIQTSQDARDVKREDDLAKRLGVALDPYASRGGLKGQMDIVNRAKRLKTLIESAPNPDRRQIEEIAIGLNALLSGSSAGAQHQVEALVPQSIWGDIKKLQERITNEPTGLDQQKFVKRMLDTIEREEGVTLKTVRDAVRGRLAEYSPLRELNRDRYESQLKARGIDPEMLDEHGLLKDEAAAESAPGAGPKRRIKVDADGNIIGG